MNRSTKIHELSRLTLTLNKDACLLPSFFAGLLIPFGFAPFHLPGLSILGLALLFRLIQHQTPKRSLYAGFAFGLGFFGLGVSWVYVSIHQYGHFNPLISALITFLFIVYLAIYPALVAFVYSILAVKRSLLFSCVLFSALWCASEFLRATLMGGFPWLLLGFGQMDTPLRYLLPIFGIYGVSFFVCFAAACLTTSMQSDYRQRCIWIIAFVVIILSPTMLKNIEWVTIENSPQSVGIIQANLSMRDKWDESLFWQLLQQYKEKFDQLIGKDKLIVMPESAIPVPANYVEEFLDNLHQQAFRSGTSVLLGIPKPTSVDETKYYNTMMALGAAEGSYLKQHLVPFGEFIPQPFQAFMNWLALPSGDMKAGITEQPLIHIKNHPVASLICYELAYPQLLRKQLPNARWIVSISDDGWFGHSFAMYQQLQIAQALSMQTARFQVVSNNDGLSSLINTKGDIIASLPAFSAGVLEGTIYPAIGSSPWVIVGDMPMLFLCFLIIIFSIFLTFIQRKSTKTTELK